MSAYRPTPVPTDAPAALRRWLARQFQQIADCLMAPQVSYVELETWNAEPDRPQDGMTVLADGSNWNPGSGQGVYTYYNSAWNKLG